ncbi:MAG: glycoside hydrolase [Planctomycetia bacterium]|nr:glycoside hydrolase [Planctomycetia bacterium]
MKRFTLILMALASTLTLASHALAADNSARYDVSEPLRLTQRGEVPLGEHFAPTTDFQAQWIVSPDLPEPVLPNLWIAYRKTFDLDAAPQVAMCRIACDSKYWLYVNGQNVVFEGGLKRGPTPFDTYYDLVDLKPYLRQGQNTIAVLHWFFGKQGFSHVNSGMPGFLFDASTNGDKGLFLLSDASWKVSLYSAVPEGLTAPNITERGNKEVHARFDSSKVPADWREKTEGSYEMTTADPQPNRRLGEWNVRFNAQYDFAGDWKSSDFDDSAWKNAKELGLPYDAKVGKPLAPWNYLFLRPSPLFRDWGMRDYVALTEIPQPDGSLLVECQLPYNLHATPCLKVEAPAGLTIDMRTDDYMGGSEYNVRAEYVTKQGVQEYESLGWMNGHKMLYTLPAGVKPLALRYRESGYDADFVSGFQCDDDFYNRFWKKAERTLYVTMRDSYFDCPDRERSHWWGDAVNELGEAFYALSRTADAIPRKAFYELARFQRADGTMYSPIPDGNWSKELPAQILATISSCGLGVYSYFSGDFQTGEDIYPAVKRYLLIWEFDDHGVVKVRNGDWSWGDWGENIDLRALLNCWYALALEEAIFLADRVGDQAGLAEFQARRETLRANFDKVFWTGSEYRSPEYQGRTDDRANALAVVAGLVAPENNAKLVEVFKTQENASPYMEKYVLQALFLLNEPDYALERLKKRFSKMVNAREYTTLWEGWGIGAEGYGGGTINHAWSGGGLTCLAQYAVGLRPIQPAFEEFIVAPSTGSLNHIKYSASTRFGLIKIELNRDLAAGTYTATIEVPEGAQGWFIPPQGYQPTDKPLQTVDNGHNDQMFKDQAVKGVKLAVGQNVVELKKN